MGLEDFAENRRSTDFPKPSEREDCPHHDVRDIQKLHISNKASGRCYDCGRTVFFTMEEE